MAHILRALNWNNLISYLNSTLVEIELIFNLYSIYLYLISFLNILIFNENIFLKQKQNKFNI